MAHLNESSESGEEACPGKEYEGEEEEEDVPCAVCGKLGDDDKALLCEECDRPYHTFCLRPVFRRNSRR